VPDIVRAPNHLPVRRTATSLRHATNLKIAGATEAINWGRQMAGGEVSWGRLLACRLARPLTRTGKPATRLNSPKSARPTILNPPYVCLRASCSREIYHATEAEVEKKHHAGSPFGNISPFLAILRKKRKISEKARASYFLSISDGGGGE
jgi:hypothetical protein